MIAVPHKWRLWALVILLVLDLAAVIAVHAGIAADLLAQIQPIVEGVLYTVLAIAVPGLADALLVERRRRTPGVPALPDDVDPPPVRGGGGSTLVVLGVLVACLASGCGASALGVQADLIATGGIVAAGADEVLVDARARELDQVLVDARAECGFDGCDGERSLYWRARLTALEDRWAPVLACRSPVVEALRAWADGLETAIAAETDDVGVELLLRLGRRFISAWGALERCVETAAPDLDLPGLPAPLAALAGGAS
jgi:hypothetical protein